MESQKQAWKDEYNLSPWVLIKNRWRMNWWPTYRMDKGNITSRKMMILFEVGLVIYFLSFPHILSSTIIWAKALPLFIYIWNDFLNYNLLQNATYSFDRFHLSCLFSPLYFPPNSISRTLLFRTHQVLSQSRLWPQTTRRSTPGNFGKPDQYTFDRRAFLGRKIDCFS